MIHNETVNVWSHLIGALFFIYLVFYVLLYMQPPSIQDRSTIERWSTGLDNGRLDTELCLIDSPSVNECPLNDEVELLEDLLESDWLQSWHGTNEGKAEPTLFHTYLDYHTAAYERAEHYLRNSVTILTQKPEFYGK